MRAPNRSGIVRLAAACLISVPGVLGAQADSTAVAQAPAPHIAQRTTCFRARPLAECRTWIPFMITTVFRLGHTSHAVDSPFGYAPGNEDDFRQLGAWGIGYMRNRDSGDAIGGLIEAGTAGFDKRLALKMRGQRWLSPSWTVSTSVGLLSAAAAGRGGRRYDARIWRNCRCRSRRRGPSGRRRNR